MMHTAKKYTKTSCPIVVYTFLPIGYAEGSHATLYLLTFHRKNDIRFTLPQRYAGWIMECNGLNMKQISSILGTKAYSYVRRQHAILKPSESPPLYACSS